MSERVAFAEEEEVLVGVFEGDAAVETDSGSESFFLLLLPSAFSSSSASAGRFLVEADFGPADMSSASPSLSFTFLSTLLAFLATSSVSFACWPFFVLPGFTGEVVSDVVAAVVSS